VARRYRRYILAVGGTVDPDRAFRRFRGRAVDPAALMRKRGFTPAAAAAGPAVAAAGPGMR
jgi:Zn-dependent oligopeptidase